MSNATTEPGRERGFFTHGPGRVLPGLGLAGGIAGLAFGLQRIPGIHALSPLILATLLGMVFRNLAGTPRAARPGIAFGLRHVLRAGIVLMGLQLTAQQVIAVGASGVAMIGLTLLATFAFTTWCGGMLGVERGLAQLIAAGSAICGASAVVATNTVTRASDESAAYAVACVTVFGSLSMVLMPLAGGFLDMDPRAFGLWTGASIHEVAQVVAAAYARGQDAGEFGTIAKLTRVMMLAPMVLMLGAAATRRMRQTGDGEGRAAAPVPWFVFGFIAMAALASTGRIPETVMPVTTAATQFLLALALAAMGLETDLRRLAAQGIRPALLGAGAWIFISVFSLCLVFMLT